MKDDDQLAKRFREVLETELGDVGPRADARQRLRRGMRPRRPWLRAPVLVPVAVAVLITALVLVIPALFAQRQTAVVPADRAPSVTTPTHRPGAVQRVPTGPTPTRTHTPRATMPPVRTTPEPTTRPGDRRRAPTAVPTRTR